MRSRFVGGLRLVLALVSCAQSAPAFAQAPAPHVPDSLLMSALDVRTGGGGGCFGDFDTATVRTPFFPQVNFLTATCTREHGDATSAIVASDSSGVLYLLGDDLSLRFLLARRGPSSIAPQDRIDWARLLLELSGRTIRQTVLIDSIGQLSAAARRALGKQAGSFYTSSFTITGLTVLLTTSRLTFDSEIIQQWKVWQLGKELVLIEELARWEGQPISRFSIPRTSPDSQLAVAASALSKDYGALHAASDTRDRDGLKGLFELTPELQGSAFPLHVDILFDQYMIWGDQPFVGVLTKCSPSVQRSVVTAMLNALPPKADTSAVPALKGLATSLGLRSAP